MKSYPLPIRVTALTLILLFTFTNSITYSDVPYVTSFLHDNNASTVAEKSLTNEKGGKFFLHQLADRLKGDKEISSTEIDSLLNEAKRSIAVEPLDVAVADQSVSETSSAVSAPQVPVAIKQPSYFSNLKIQVSNFVSSVTQNFLAIDQAVSNLPVFVYLRSLIHLRYENFIPAYQLAVVPTQASLSYKLARQVRSELRNGYVPPLRIENPEQQIEAEEHFKADAVGAWSAMGKRLIKWYDRTNNAWVSYNDQTGKWEGFSAATGESVSFSTPENDAPWKYTYSWFDRDRKVWKAFNPQADRWEEFPGDPNDSLPLFKYFDGGKTNVSFNALDLHVLSGEGNKVIDTVELEPSDESGRPTSVQTYTYRQILKEVAKFTYVLKNNLGLKEGDKIALNIPNGIEWKIVALAAARLGIAYTPPFALRGPDEVRDQMKDIGARTLITVDGYFHAGQLQHHKKEKVDAALEGYDNYFHVSDVREALVQGMDQNGVAAEVRDAILEVYNRSKDDNGFGAKDLITTQREDLESFINTQLLSEHKVAGGVEIRVMRSVFDYLEARVNETSIQNVVVFDRERERTAKEGMKMAEGRDHWANELMDEAEQELTDIASSVFGENFNSAMVDQLSDQDFMKIISGFAPAVPVDSEHPLFAIYTSGSTGKPKGALHTTAGYMIGLKYAINLVQDFDKESVFLVYADPGWITGQSAGLFAPYLAGLSSITYQGALNIPNQERLIDLLERYGVTHFKAGAPVHRGLRSAGSDQFAGRSLKVKQCINCAEPGDPETQAFINAVFGDDTYLNNLWRTEDGFQTFGTVPRGVKQALDASVYPLPFAFMEVIAPLLDDKGEETGRYRLGVSGKGKGADFDLTDVRNALDYIMKSQGTSAEQQAFVAGKLNEYKNKTDRHSLELFTRAALDEAGVKPVLIRVVLEQFFEVLEEGELGLLVSKTTPHQVRTLVRDSDRFLKTYWSLNAVKASNIEGWPDADQIHYGNVYPDLHIVGDAGRKILHDNRTHFIIPGRADDVMNVAGNRIGTRDIESGLVSFRDKKVVAEAAAIGIPHPVTKQTPIAFVKLLPGTQPSDALEQELRTHLEKTKSPHYRPSEIFFVKNLPLTLSGKNMRRFLGYVGSLKREQLREIIRLLDEGGDELAGRIRKKEKDAINEIFPGLGNITSLANPESIIETVRAVAEKREIGKPAKVQPRATADQVDLSLYRPDAETEARLVQEGKLLPEDAKIVPGVTKIPEFMHAWANVKGTTGAPYHGDPKDTIKKVVVPTPQIGENDALIVPLWMGGTYNAIWAATGVPVSVFDVHDSDYHVPGSGSVGLVVKMGDNAAKDGRIKVGQLVFSFPFETNPHSPTAGADLSFADPQIPGYETPEGHAAQFIRTQVQNTFALPDNLPPGLNYSDIAQISLDIPTVWKAIVSEGMLKAGQNMFMEGAAGGTGLYGVVIGAMLAANVTGLVSTTDKIELIKHFGAKSGINRKDEQFKGIWAGVPEDSAKWMEWLAAGEALVEEFKKKNGRLADVIISHAGKEPFGRDVQLLADGGKLVFFGASSGYNLSFMGKEGGKDPGDIFDDARLKPNEGVVIYYGHPEDVAADGVEDVVGVSAIREALKRGARVAVVVRTNDQQVYLQNQFSDEIKAGKLKGMVSIELLEMDPNFEWREMPDADENPADYEDWENHTFKTIGAEVGRLLRTSMNPRGNPHVVFERASQNTLGLSARMAMPYFGRVVFSEPTAGRRYSFYAPNVWMHQKDVYFPWGTIVGSHMANANQVNEVLQRILRKELALHAPTIMGWDQFPEGMQLVYENKHQGSVVFRNTIAPEGKFRTRADLLTAMGFEIPTQLADQAHVRVMISPVEADKKVAQVVLSNPAQANALNREMLEELYATMKYLQERDDVKAILITGAGSQYFVSGQDIGQLYRMADKQDALDQARRAHEAFAMIENSEKPVVVAVNGFALGGGNELQMSAHYRLATNDAEFGQPEINIGLIPGYGGTQRVARLIEQQLWNQNKAATDEEAKSEAIRLAAQISIGGRRLSAHEAAELGLINEVVADPVARGYALIREFIETGRGTLAGARRYRTQHAVQNWKKPFKFEKFSLLEDPEVQRILKQGYTSSQSSGLKGTRAPIMLKALEAIWKGYEEGIDAGYAAEAEAFADLVISNASKELMAAFQRKDTQPLAPRKIDYNRSELRTLSGIVIPVSGLVNEMFHSGAWQFVKEQAKFLNAASVEILDASDDDRLLAEEVAAGKLTALPDGNFYTRSHPDDVARSEDKTYVATKDEKDKGLFNNWRNSDEIKAPIEKLMKDSLAGKKIYVIPYLMGPASSPFSQVGIEITDSRYVALNMIRMTRVGKVALNEIKNKGKFTRGIHVTGDLNKLAAERKADPKNDNRYFASFPDENLILSYGSAYGGNALLGKKFHALRQAMYDGVKEGWLAEHMFAFELKDRKTGELQYVAGAYPSASGKTNAAMMKVIEEYQDQYEIRFFSDDILWLRKGKDGELRAINPERGLFGVVPGTNMKSNPNAMEAISKAGKTLFTNVAYNEITGKLWWEGHDLPRPDGEPGWRNWKGELISELPAERKSEPWAHPNSRFTTSIDNVSNLSEHWEDPQGVAIDIFLFGGRVGSREVLIRETRSIEEGIYDALTMGVETTAAATGAVGVLREDPMAQRPFFSPNLGDYVANWLRVMRSLKRPPKIFHVNWFRKGADGKFLWKGYGYNLIPILWGLKRAKHPEATDNYVETPFGNIPTPEALGLPATPELKEVLSVNMDEWRTELSRRGGWFDDFNTQFPNRMPREILAEQEMAVRRASELRNDVVLDGQFGNNLLGDFFKIVAEWTTKVAGRIPGTNVGNIQDGISGDFIAFTSNDGIGISIGHPDAAKQELEIRIRFAGRNENWRPFLSFDQSRLNIHDPYESQTQSHFTSAENIVTALRFEKIDEDHAFVLVANEAISRVLNFNLNLLTESLGKIPLRIVPSSRSELRKTVVTTTNLSPKDELAVLYDVLTQLRHEKEKAGSGVLPHVSVISDQHGAIDRFDALIVDAINQVVPGKLPKNFELDHDKNLEDQISVHGITLDDLRGKIHFHNLGDFMDRGPYGVKVYRRSEELIDAGLSDFVPGNHDFWMFMNLQGFHLPWYEGYNFYNYSDSFDGELSTVQDLVAEGRRAQPETKTKSWWAARAAEYTKFYTDKQKERWAAIDIEVGGSYDKDKRAKGSDSLYSRVAPGIGKDGNLKKLWDKFRGYSQSATTDVYIGTRAVGLVSVKWWEELLGDFQTAYQAIKAEPGYDSELPANQAWERAIEIMEKEIVPEVVKDLKEKLHEGKWWWRVFEAINYQNYTSPEWWAKDWVFHKDWGTAVLKELNQENPSTNVDSANYLENNTLERIAGFFKSNFNLYQRDIYQNTYMHAFLPVDMNTGEFHFTYKGVDYRGKGSKEHPSVWVGLDLISKDVRENTSLKDLYEAYQLVNSWYADNTTKIKVPDVAAAINKFGAKKLAEMNGFNRLFTGHLPFHEFFTKIPAEKRGHITGFNVDNILFSVDHGMGPKFGGRGGRVGVSLSNGIQLRGFEHEGTNEIKENARTVQTRPSTEGAAEVVIAENPGFKPAEFFNQLTTDVKNRINELESALDKTSKVDAFKTHLEILTPEELEDAKRRLQQRLEAFMAQFHDGFNTLDGEALNNLSNEISFITEVSALVVNTINRQRSELRQKGKTAEPRIQQTDVEYAVTQLVGHYRLRRSGVNNHAVAKYVRNLHVAEVKRQLEENLGLPHGRNNLHITKEQVDAAAQTYIASHLRAELRQQPSSGGSAFAWAEGGKIFIQFPGTEHVEVKNPGELAVALTQHGFRAAKVVGHSRVQVYVRDNLQHIEWNAQDPNDVAVGFNNLFRDELRNNAAAAYFVDPAAVLQALWTNSDEEEFTELNNLMIDGGIDKLSRVIAQLITDIKTDAERLASNGLWQQQHPGEPALTWEGFNNALTFRLGLVVEGFDASSNVVGLIREVLEEDKLIPGVSNPPRAELRRITPSLDAAFKTLPSSSVDESFFTRLRDSLIPILTTRKAPANETRAAVRDALLKAGVRAEHLNTPTAFVLLSGFIYEFGDLIYDIAQNLDRQHALVARVSTKAEIKALRQINEKLAEGGYQPIRVVVNDRQLKQSIRDSEAANVYALAAKADRQIANLLKQNGIIKQVTDLIVIKSADQLRLMFRISEVVTANFKSAIRLAVSA